MCRYRYYYFGTCGHQQTTLFDFCSNAHPIHSAERSKEAPAVPIRGKHDVCSNDERVAGAGQGKQEAKPFRHDDEILSVSPKTLTPSTFADIVSSLPADHSAHSSSPTTVSHNMAGLPLSSGTFRHWMSGATTVAPKSVPDVQGHASTSSKGTKHTPQTLSSYAAVAGSRSRQPGIRERTDESCDLSRSNEIMQHLAESYRGSSSKDVCIGGQTLASYGSTSTQQTLQERYDAGKENYDSLEAEIDQLKEEVMRLREGADEGRTEAKTEQELANDKYLSVRSGKKQPVSSEKAIESAAVRLQKQHEESGSGLMSMSEAPSSAQQSLCASDFPALDVAKVDQINPTQPIRPGQQRKISYADAATNGMIDGLDHVFSAAMTKRADAKLSDSTSEGPLSLASMLSRTRTNTTPTTQDSSEHQGEGDYSVIISPRSVETESSTNDPIIVARGLQSAKNGKPAKQGPRFAQPTQSFSRRTGETLRVDSSPISPKSSPSGSPIKATRAKEPSLATDKRAAQRQQKRKSLPGDWIDGDSIQVEAPQAEATTNVDSSSPVTPGKIQSPASIISPPSSEGWQIVQGRASKTNAATTATNAKASKPQERTQAPQKSKSYMAPTSAAKQRAAPPVKTDKLKREQAQSKPGISSFVSNQIVQPLTKPHRSSTASSAASSVQFILDSAPPASAACLGRVISNAQDHSSIASKITMAVPLSKSAVLCKPEQKFASKLPRPAANIENIPQQAVASDPVNTDRGHAGLGTMPEVSNTTTKRRMSHGHLLKPIVERLDAEGLLNRTAATNSVLDRYLPSATADPFGRGSKLHNGESTVALDRVLARSMDSVQQVSDMTKVTRALAPHLRKSRETSLASNSSNATLCPQLGSNAFNSGLHTTSPTASVPLPDAMAMNMPALSERPNGTPTGVQSSRTSSLRATASEFKPMQPLAEEPSQPDLQTAIRYLPADQWMRMSPLQKAVVRTLRNMYNPDGAQSRHSAPEQHSSPELHSGTLRDAPPPYKPMPASLQDTNVRAVTENGSPNGVQPGQVLRPSFSPGKKSVQWLLKDLDGKEGPINFGRAPPPNVVPDFKPPTPTISSTSNDSSPLKTPHSLRGWHIGSAFSPMPYGWTGGDGKEIKFIGYGPHAEKDPNSVVNFNFQGHVGSYNSGATNAFYEDKENLSSDSHVAPKSQRQWAEKLGYSKVPCGNVETTRATEYMIPFGSQLAGYCYDCMAR